MKEYSIDDQLGLCIDWYAVDSNDHIARFSSGGGVLPNCVTENRQAVERVLKYLDRLEGNTRHKVPETAREQEIYRRNEQVYRAESSDTSLGVYLYDDADYFDKFAPKYFCFSIPSSILGIDDLEEPIQANLKLIRFRGEFRQHCTISNSDFI